MFKKLLNILLIFFAFIILTFVVVIAGLKVVFTETRLKQLSKDAIRGFISRDASFGRFRWGVNGIEIDNFALSEPSDFKAGTSVTARKITIRPAFLPWEPSGGIVIDSPTINVAIKPRGWNFSDINDYIVKYGGAEENKHYSYLAAPYSLRINMVQYLFQARKKGRRAGAITNINLLAIRNVSGRVVDASIEARIIRGDVRLGLDSKAIP